MRTGDRTVWLVALVDAVLTYPFVFAADALMPGVEGPHATTWYWMTQPWVYALIAPVAAVAAWRGVRQVQAVRAGRPRWWRLPVEGAGFAVGAVLITVLGLGGGIEGFVLALLQCAALGGGLGVLLTCANYLLTRRLHHTSVPA